MKRMVLLSLVVVALISSCKQEEVTPSISETKRLLTTGEWIRTGFERNGNDVWIIFPDCAKDDYTGFRLDGVAYIDQGSDVCDTSSPMRSEWKWALTENETQLVETLNDSVQYTRTLLKLDEQFLEFESYHGSDHYKYYFEKK